jgi:hypothetical protein
MPTVTEAFRTGRLSYSKVRLPKEEAAVVLSAMDTARDQFGPPPAKPDQTLDEVTAAPMYGRADALVDVARSFTNWAPADRSGEDHHLVVVHVDADLLTDLPAGKESKDVPAGTSQAQGAVCHIQGVGSVEPATAQRLACDSTLLGALTNSDGEVLHLGRTRRLVSKAQRRALTIRDQMCRYPGCAQTRHLDAPPCDPVGGWRTDRPGQLDPAVPLASHRCPRRRNHHRSRGRRVAVHLPDGSEPRPWQTADTLADLLTAHARKAAETIAAVDRFDHPAARTIRPRWAGEPFSVHDCVRRSSPSGYLNRRGRAKTNNKPPSRQDLPSDSRLRRQPGHGQAVKPPAGRRPCATVISMYRTGLLS